METRKSYSISLISHLVTIPIITVYIYIWNWPVRTMKALIHHFNVRLQRRKPKKSTFPSSRCIIHWGGVILWDVVAVLNGVWAKPKNFHKEHLLRGWHAKKWPGKAPNHHMHSGSSLSIKLVHAVTSAECHLHPFCQHDLSSAAQTSIHGDTAATRNTQTHTLRSEERQSWKCVMWRRDSWNFCCYCICCYTSTPSCFWTTPPKI